MIELNMKCSFVVGSWTDMIGLFKIGCVKVQDAILGHIRASGNEFEFASR